ncbi:MAG: hypothetical protein R3C28_23925 [Pirellulaceae bacterium]
MQDTTEQTQVAFARLSSETEFMKQIRMQRKSLSVLMTLAMLCQQSTLTAKSRWPDQRQLSPSCTTPIFR